MNKSCAIGLSCQKEVVQQCCLMSALIDGNELFKKSFCDHFVDQDFGNLPLLLCNAIILEKNA